MSQITRYPGWLYSALGVKDPALPAAIAGSEPILLAQEAYEHGHGLATWRMGGGGHVGVQPATEYTLLASDGDVIRKVTEFSIENSGTEGSTGDYEVRLYELRKDGSIANGPLIAAMAATPAAGEIRSSRRLNTGTGLATGMNWTKNLTLPPLWELRLFMPVTLTGGNSQVWYFQYVEGPAGFWLPAEA